MVTFDPRSACAGVTGRIDEVRVAFGSGSSTWRVAVVVNAREAVSLAAAL